MLCIEFEHGMVAWSHKKTSYGFNLYDLVLYGTHVLLAIVENMKKKKPRKLGSKNPQIVNTRKYTENIFSLILECVFFLCVQPSATIE